MHNCLFVFSISIALPGTRVISSRVIQLVLFTKLWWKKNREDNIWWEIYGAGNIWKYMVLEIYGAVHEIVVEKKTGKIGGT